MLKKLLLITGAAIGGIYLTSEEGKKARESLLKRKSAYEPIVRDLIKQSNEVLEGTKTIDSKEVKANIDMLINEAKKSLIELDLDKATETVKDAIRVASKKIRIAVNETEKELNASKKKITAKKSPNTGKAAPKKKNSAKKVLSKNPNKQDKKIT